MGIHVFPHPEPPSHTPLHHITGFSQSTGFGCPASCIKLAVGSCIFCLWTWTQTEIYTVSFPGSQAFRLGLEIISLDLLGSDSLAFQSIEPVFLTSLCIDASLEISVSLYVSGGFVCPAASYLFCFSGEPWRMHSHSHSYSHAHK